MSQSGDDDLRREMDDIRRQLKRAVTPQAELQLRHRLREVRRQLGEPEPVVTGDPFAPKRPEHWLRKLFTRLISP